jgi:hypothetical protein
MGQQQIILIVLSVIIVGTAISVGLLMFQSSGISANRDAIIQDLNILVANARGYYMKPKSYGGGGRSYVGYKIPAKIIASMSENATYDGTGTRPIADGYQFEGVSNTYDGSIIVKVDKFHDQPFGWNPTGDFEEE